MGSHRRSDTGAQLVGCSRTPRGVVSETTDSRVKSKRLALVTDRSLTSPQAAARPREPENNSESRRDPESIFPQFKGHFAVSPQVAKLPLITLPRLGSRVRIPSSAPSISAGHDAFPRGPSGPSIAPIRPPSHIRPTLKARCAGIWRAMTVASGRVVRHPGVGCTGGRCRAARLAWWGSRRVRDGESCACCGRRTCRTTWSS